MSARPHVLHQMALANERAPASQRIDPGYFADDSFDAWREQSEHIAHDYESELKAGQLNENLADFLREELESPTRLLGLFSAVAQGDKDGAFNLLRLILPLAITKCDDYDTDLAELAYSEASKD